MEEAIGRVAAADMRSLVDVPSNDVSLKDGFALRVKDVAGASAERPVALKLIDTVAAGSVPTAVIRQGTAARILSGAILPLGAEAVLSAEFGKVDGTNVTACNDVHKGSNILGKSVDIAMGDTIVAAGTPLGPGHIGLLVAGGYTSVPVHRTPSVHIIATGDEVVEPGAPLDAGQVFASNLASIGAWCRKLGIKPGTTIARDSERELSKAIIRNAPGTDCLITIGGAWQGERDLVVRVLEALGWQETYHNVKMGPGKAVGFGLLEAVAVFCLPGGPPSNQMAFLQLVLPGLQALGGRRVLGLQTGPAVLAETVKGQADWTQFVTGTFSVGNGQLVFTPLRGDSRLKRLAAAEGILTIPEGTEEIAVGENVSVQFLY